MLDGDGSLLMNLGSLVTIAGVQPRNLIHVVLDNGLYELPGSVPLPAQGRFSLPDFARAAGLTHIHEYDELEAFRTGLKELLTRDGTAFVTAKVAPGSGEGLPRMTLVQMTRKLEEALRVGS